MLNKIVKKAIFWKVLTAKKILLKIAIFDGRESRKRTMDMIKMRLECFELIERFAHYCCALLV